MNTIYKYPITTPDSDNKVHLYMPSSAVPLHVNVQGGQPMLWAMVDTREPLREHVFYLYGTGHDCNRHHSEYVGTFFDGPYVWHLFTG